MYFRLALLVISAALLVACNSAQKPVGSTNAGSAPSQTAASPQVPTVHADGVRRITTVELRDLLAKNQAVVIDVRTEASYKQGHIHGAKLIPVADVLQKADELPKDKLIVTYCS
jgi:3-mercaptopyruvate sulfurtransferase SseA